MMSAGKRKPLDEVLQEASSVAVFVLNAIVTPHEKTPPQWLVQAAIIPWARIFDELGVGPHRAIGFPPRRWEELVASAYCGAMFDEVTLLPHQHDLGRDVIALKRGVGSIRIPGPLKVYPRGTFVSSAEILALIDAVHVDDDSVGFVMTTSSFAPIVEDELKRRHATPRLRLLTGPQLVEHLNALGRRG